MKTVCLGKEYYHKLRDMEQWCEKSLGDGDYGFWDPNYSEEHGHLWRYNTSFGNTAFHFRRDQDAVLFTLKWL